MELKEILNRLSMPVKPKINEEELIKNEENNISEVMNNVNYFINLPPYIKFSQKKTNFVPLGFETKDEEENEEGIKIILFFLVDYSEYSVDDYIDDIPS